MKGLFLSTLLLLGLTACGGGGGQVSLTPSSPVLPVPTKLVVGIGDSIMAGSVDSSGTYVTSYNYMDVIATIAHVNVLNLAQPGYWAANMIAREVPRIPKTANIVVIGDGTNDMYGNFPEADFDALVAAVQNAAPTARLIFVTPRRFVYPTTGVDYSAQIHAWAVHEKAIAAIVGATVLDLENMPMSPSDWFGVHPTALGVGDIASALAPLIN